MREFTPTVWTLIILAFWSDLPAPTTLYLSPNSDEQCSATAVRIGMTRADRRKLTVRAAESIDR